jgi:hypothetical protein
MRLLDERSSSSLASHMDPPTPCRYFRNKEMYVPDQEEAAFSDKFDPGAFSHCWCNKTMTEIGADDNLVSFSRCSSAERTCYQAP